jgi:ATP phosphoribosyltransferase
VAVVPNEVPAATISEFREIWRNSEKPVRVAAEYINIADKYARENHLGAYRVIPTWGATEAFLPEDADLLIENTETGATLARNNLKIIDTLFQSSGCLIGRKGAVNELKQSRIDRIVSMLRGTVSVPAGR